LTLLVQPSLFGLLGRKGLDPTLFRLLRLDPTPLRLLRLDPTLFFPLCRQSALPIGTSLSLAGSLLLRGNCSLLRFGLLAELATRLRREARLRESCMAKRQQEQDSSKCDVLHARIDPM
jgi:hypothetical protein